MKKSVKQILLFVMKDESRKTFSVPQGSSAEEVTRKVISSEDINKDDIGQVLYFPTTFYDLEEIQYYYDTDTKKVDEKRVAIEFKLEEFRKQRGLLFNLLDAQFMRALENMECDSCRQKVVNIKEHLRDLPNYLEEHLQDLDTEQITKFNCFNNVYDINIINCGSGYDFYPEVTISPPCVGEKVGIQMEGFAVLKDEKVIGIKITRPGAGYLKTPSVSIEKSKKGNTAIGIASNPENDINHIKL